MWDGLEQSSAWDTAHNPEIAGSLDAQQYYSVLVAAGYDEAVSQKAASDRAEARLIKGLTP